MRSPFNAGHGRRIVFPGSEETEGKMFEAYCRHCEARMLLSPRRVLSMHNTSDGIVVYFRCWRGHAGVFVTGRSAGRPSAVPAADAKGTPAEGRPEVASAGAA